MIVFLFLPSKIGDNVITNYFEITYIERKILLKIIIHDDDYDDDD